jgi:hypothetical protein
MVRKGILVRYMIILCFVGAGFSCHIFKKKPKPINYRYGTFKFKQKPDEVFLSYNFTSFLKSNPYCSFVLRVPSRSATMLEEESSFNRSMYFAIEKTLLQNNFKVRDRSLFEKNFTLDSTKSHTDLILELVNFRTVNYHTNKVVPDASKDEVESTLPKYFYFTGGQAEFKITNIASNEIVATFILNYTPCTKGCKMKYSDEGEITELDGDFKARKKNGYESVDTDEDTEMFRELAERLVFELRRPR